MGNKQKILWDRFLWTSTNVKCYLKWWEDHTGLVPSNRQTINWVSFNLKNLLFLWWWWRRRHQLRILFWQMRNFFIVNNLKFSTDRKRSMDPTKVYQNPITHADSQLIILLYISFKILLLDTSMQCITQYSAFCTYILKEIYNSECSDKYMFVITCSFIGSLLPIANISLLFLLCEHNKKKNMKLKSDQDINHHWNKPWFYPHSIIHYVLYTLQCSENVLGKEGILH